MAGSSALYDFSIPMFIHTLEALAAVLNKGAEHAKANNVQLSEYFEGRLADDMYPFAFQIQTACNTAKFVPVRIGGVENVSMEDNEKTYEELQTRITATIELLKKVKPEDMAGKEESEVIFREFKFTGTTYLTNYAVPNFYFHVVTAYDILRSKGVPVGKFDYLGVMKKA